MIQLFNKRQFLSVKDGTERLLAYSRVEFDAKDLSKLALKPDEADEFRSLVRTTKEAIIIAHLRRAASCKSPDSREYAFVDAFEEMTVFCFPPKSTDEHIRRIGDLVSKIERLDQIMRLTNESALRIAIPEWSGRWLETIWDDPELVTRTTLLFGGEICIYIHKQIVLIENAVKSVIYEKQ